MNIKLSNVKMLTLMIFVILILYIILFLFNLSFYETTVQQFEDLKKIMIEIRNGKNGQCR